VSLALDLRNAPPGTGQKTWSGCLEGYRRGAGGVPLIGRNGDGVKPWEIITACARSHARNRGVEHGSQGAQAQAICREWVSGVEGRGRVHLSGPGVLGR